MKFMKKLWNLIELNKAKTSYISSILEPMIFFTLKTKMIILEINDAFYGKMGDNEPK